ncbi:MAG: N-hydroxyarylamine O-acetyltransferase [Nitrospira sp.]|nr:MAG: N-hydroxyarylamine O-acetyltransferase [Nitrospira sp.]
MFDRPAYFTRIGYEGSVDHSAEILRALHLAHVLTVPFENLDIHLGQPISLEPVDLFRKIVVNRRGGYCFELNGLFALLLEDLGFAVTRLAARVLYGAEGVRPRSHQALLVSVGEERWVVDVGFGGNGLREPFLLTIGQEQQQGPDRFRLVTDGRGDYLLQCEIDGAWTDLYSFTLEPNLPVDYTFANYYHSHSPDSLFTQRLICTVPTLKGRTIFTDRWLKIRSDGATRELHVKDQEECRQLLQEHFGLTIKDDLSLF